MVATTVKFSASVQVKKHLKLIIFVVQSHFVQPDSLSANLPKEMDRHISVVVSYVLKSILKKKKN